MLFFLHVCYHCRACLPRSRRPPAFVSDCNFLEVVHRVVAIGARQQLLFPVTFPQELAQVTERLSHFFLLFEACFFPSSSQLCSNHVVQLHNVEV